MIILRFPRVNNNKNEGKSNNSSQILQYSFFTWYQSFETNHVNTFNF